MRLLAAFVLASSLTAQARASDTMVSFRYDNGELSSMISSFAKASGRKFIVDPSVRGRISVFLPGEVSLDEAYNILCESLSINGFTVVEEGDTTSIIAARNAQRDAIPTVTTVPPLKPNKMMTLVYKLNYIPSEEVVKRLRILPSKDGEITTFEPTNSLIISDYAANLNRVADILKQLDQPSAAKWKPKPAPPAAPKAPKE